MARSIAMFSAWAVVGFVGSFVLLYGFTPIGPPIVLVLWLSYRFLPRVSGNVLPEAAGALGGFGAFWLFVATTVDGDVAAFVALGAIAWVASLAWYLTAGHRRCTRRLPAG